MLSRLVITFLPRSNHLLISFRIDWFGLFAVQGTDPITSWQIDGETAETVADFISWGAPKSLQMVTAAMKLKDACSFKEKL